MQVWVVVCFFLGGPLKVKWSAKNQTPDLLIFRTFAGSNEFIFSWNHLLWSGAKGPKKTCFYTMVLTCRTLKQVIYWKTNHRWIYIYLIYHDTPNISQQKKEPNFWPFNLVNFHQRWEDSETLVDHCVQTLLAARRWAQGCFDRFDSMKSHSIMWGTHPTIYHWPDETQGISSTWRPGGGFCDAMGQVSLL